MIAKIIRYLVLLLGYFVIVVSVGIFLESIIKIFMIAHPTTWTSNTGLPNLVKLYYPALLMYIHILAGSIIMICGLLQIIPFLRKPKFIILHRIVGNIICIFSVIVCICGNLYIYTTGTIGQTNMDIAFSVARWILGIFSVVTYVYARKKYGNVQALGS